MAILCLTPEIEVISPTEEQNIWVRDELAVESALGSRYDRVDLTSFELQLSFTLEDGIINLIDSSGYLDELTNVSGLGSG